MTSFGGFSDRYDSYMYNFFGEKYTCSNLTSVLLIVKFGKVANFRVAQFQSCGSLTAFINKHSTETLYSTETILKTFLKSNNDTLSLTIKYSWHDSIMLVHSFNYSMSSFRAVYVTFYVAYMVVCYLSLYVERERLILLPTWPHRLQTQISPPKLDSQLSATLGSHIWFDDEVGRYLCAWTLTPLSQSIY
jgi:hypothetical protein